MEKIHLKTAATKNIVNDLNNLFVFFKYVFHVFFPILANCERETYKIHQHYCNRELVELLVFDARVTNTSYGTWKFDSVKIKNLIDTYNATLRFVATMSGLTRWQFIYGEEVEREDDKYGTNSLNKNLIQRK